MGFLFVVVERGGDFKGLEGGEIGGCEVDEGVGGGG